MSSSNPPDDATKESSIIAPGDAFLHFSERFSLKEIKRRLEKAWEDFTQLGKLDQQIVRPEIAAAWRRCREYQVDCHMQRVPDGLGASAFEASIIRRIELEAVAGPHLKRLGDFLRGRSCVAVLLDAQAEILSVSGDPSVAAILEKINFMEKAVWTEDIAGDNGPGTCLAVGHPVQVVSAEHFCAGWHDFVCTASPIRDPFTHEPVGALNISGPISEIHRHAYGILMGSVVQIERGFLELRYREEYWLQQEALNAVASMSPEAIIVTDAKGMVRSVNDSAKEYLRPASTQDSMYQISDLDLATAGKDVQSKKTRETSITIAGRCLPVLVSPVLRYGKRLGSVITFSETRKPASRRAKRPHTGAVRITRILGNSPALQEAIGRAERVAPYDSTVLVEGESGTGKELFARLIHDLSPRYSGPFLAINCAAVPSELLATELFGYEQGAFTGADRRGRPGKFELADTGSLVLDEISELPKPLQVYLLRFLQERSFYRVGGTKLSHVDVRVIALSNKPLDEEVSAGRFREDLLYRLKVMSILVPPLRERKEDIPVLADHFLSKLESRLGIRRKRLTEEAAERLKGYSWPGNVRELENAIECAVIMSDTNRVDVSNLPHFLTDHTDHVRPGPESAALDEAEARILRALELNDWNATKAAKDLGVSRATLYRLLDRHGLTIRKHLSDR